jgi:amidase
VRPEFPTGLFEPVVDGRDVRAATATELCRTLGEVASMLGRPIEEEDVEPFTWALARATEPAPAAAYLRLQRAKQRWAARIVPWWGSGFDLLLTPTVYEPAVLLDELTPPADNPAQLARRVVAHCRFTQPFNVTGQPAISLPLHETEDGLPVGVQLIADCMREDLLLRVASQLETARPWADRYAKLPG